MNKVAIITGASRGIGAACAKLFAQSGYCVAVCYKSNYEKARLLAEDINNNGGTAIEIYTDVADKSSVNMMYSEVCSRLGKPQVLINNAGIAQQKLFNDITEHDWDIMFDTNVKGMYNCIKAVMDNMISSKYGKIVNISSIWGLVGASCEVHYSASKAAVIGLTKALAKELGPSGINVNCVAPGVIDTDMLAGFSQQDKYELAQETPINRLGTAEDIAQTVLFLCSDGADFITGQIISPNGGFVI